MMTLRPAAERGHARHGWLDTKHTFSFARYHDPAYMGFRSLRVINEDIVSPGRGFGKHPHDNMEIVTYVLSGALRHEDSMGNGEILRAGEVQRMTAGTGIMHSEVNASTDDPVHLLQIWLLPAERGLEPSYEQRAFDTGREGLQLLVSPSGEGDSLSIHQDARIYLAQWAGSGSEDLRIGEDRHAWVQVTRGAIRVDDRVLEAGDGLAVSERASLRIGSESGGEALVFDLA